MHAVVRLRRGALALSAFLALSGCGAPHGTAVPSEPPPPATTVHYGLPAGPVEPGTDTIYLTVGDVLVVDAEGTLGPPSVDSTNLQLQPLPDQMSFRSWILRAMSPGHATMLLPIDSHCPPDGPCTPLVFAVAVTIV